MMSIKETWLALITSEIKYRHNGNIQICRSEFTLVITIATRIRIEVNTGVVLCDLCLAVLKLEIIPAHAIAPLHEKFIRHPCPVNGVEPNIPRPPRTHSIQTIVLTGKTSVAYVIVGA